MSQGPVSPPGASSELPGGLGQLRTLWAPCTAMPPGPMRRHSLHRTAACGQSPSCLPPRLSEDRGQLIFPGIPLASRGLQSFVMEMGMTTEPRGAMGPMCGCVYGRVWVCGEVQAQGVGWGECTVPWEPGDVWLSLCPPPKGARARGRASGLLRSEALATSSFGRR